MPKSPKPTYRIKFHNHNKIYELYAHEVSQSQMAGFIEIGEGPLLILASAFIWGCILVVIKSLGKRDVCLLSTTIAWHEDWWPIRHPLDYTGGAGGGGFCSFAPYRSPQLVSLLAGALTILAARRRRRRPERRAQR